MKGGRGGTFRPSKANIPFITLSFMSLELFPSVLQHSLNQGSFESTTIASVGSDLSR